ncbi:MULTISPECIES: AMP-dependent synthetase/ligase [unclassified Olleya]|jgi:long-chain acyl-CoA synthetase|uniref:AMP-dependent synthetase/ligase n=1 Tax=unclassified Olleya TaxID=2615019 RepID=UPI0011A33DE9|nr:AMP-dependent synthetase/ligase [Olleya sp. Hel_I_94]TVZ47036.1 long-chain acyl-CoA synthetase [Olleya sp. Hel_I_94]|tara:strand:+ start:147844 stop:149613 length:1770 start_codon:yes stop_codon:yes gene_type:complete
MIEITRLFDFPYYQLEKYNLENSLSTKYDGKWVSISTKKYLEQANTISRGLLRLGVSKNDKIAVISSTNRTEWNIMDIGILQLGAQNVPVYPTISEEDYAYVLNHAEAKYCFISCQEVYNKVIKIKAEVPSLIEVYCFDQLENCKNWNEVLELGKDQSNQNEVEKLKDNVKASDLATLIYTSGTTGKPKGVMLSHDNLVSNALESFKRIPIGLGTAKALSFLPLCHVYERMLIYLYQYCGASIHYAPIDQISEYAQEVKPQVMTAVPRLLEKVYDKIIAKGAELTGIKKKLFFWAVDVGLQYKPYGENGWWYTQKLNLANKLIFSKWKAALGGEVKVMASGSAALQPRLARVFNAAGFGVMEGYGLTETSPVVSVNDMRNGGFKIGTVGKLLDRTEVKIAEDGEICVKGPQVMMGYYKDEAKTAEVIKDGYFHTGDIGVIDDEGFLKITDRKKEMFKTSGGKYVAPQLLENRCKQSRFIDQIMVIGEGEKMPAAIIQPDFEFIRNWAKIHNKTLGTNEALVANPEVIARIQEEIDTANTKFAKWEKIKQFRLTAEAWTVEGGHLTPTLKLKRKIIKEKYKALYNDIYGY